MSDSKPSQYISIDAIESSIFPSLPCSVIQGSKLSVLLYILYINQVPVLHNLLNDNRYICIKNEEPLDEIKVLDHIMIQYVDDSNNLITTDDITHIEQYINKYFRLIEGYYNLNKLKINPDRSEIMIICKPN